MKEQNFQFFEELLRQQSGLVITPDKMYLLESRLLPIAHKKGIQTLDELVEHLRATPDQDLRYSIVEAMTTNETSFFRDKTPFERLKNDVLPVFCKTRAAQRKLRIWSAACSSGQEPYSLAMLLKEMPELAGWNIEIVATDLSNAILAQAESGTYSQFEVQRGLPVQMLVKYFTQDGDKWTAKPELKSMIKFKPANLLTDVPKMGTFDIVLCRNVLIYFDVPTKARVLGEIKNTLAQDGVLFLGGAETMIGITNEFKPVLNLKGVYIRSDGEFNIEG